MPDHQWLFRYFSNSAQLAIIHSELCNGQDFSHLHGSPDGPLIKGDPSTACTLTLSAHLGRGNPPCCACMRP